MSSYGLNPPEFEEPEEKKSEHAVIVLLDEDFALKQIAELRIVLGVQKVEQGYESMEYLDNQKPAVRGEDGFFSLVSVRFRTFGLQSPLSTIAEFLLNYP